MCSDFKVCGSKSMKTSYDASGFSAHPRSAVKGVLVGGMHGLRDRFPLNLTINADANTKA